MKFEMKINGRKVTSGSQIERELTKVAECAVEDGIRKAAWPSVRIKKTREGYIAEGSPYQIDRLTRSFAACVKIWWQSQRKAHYNLCIRAVLLC